MQSSAFSEQLKHFLCLNFILFCKTLHFTVPVFLEMLDSRKLEGEGKASKAQFSELDPKKGGEHVNMHQDPQNPASIVI